MRVQKINSLIKQNKLNTLEKSIVKVRVSTINHDISWDLTQSKIYEGTGKHVYSREKIISGDQPKIWN